MGYFDDSDTLYIEFTSTDIVDTKDLDKNSTLDLDSNGDIVVITLGDARSRTDIGHVMTLSNYLFDYVFVLGISLIVLCLYRVLHKT